MAGACFAGAQPLYKEEQMKRKPYIAQEKEILLQSIAAVGKYLCEKTLEITIMTGVRGTEIK